MSEPSNGFCGLCNSRLSGDWTCPNCRLSPHVSDTFNGPVYLTNSGAFSTSQEKSPPSAYTPTPSHTASGTGYACLTCGRPLKNNFQACVCQMAEAKPTVDTATILAAIERMEESFMLALSEVRNRLPPERPAPPTYTWRDPFSHDYRLGAPEND